jgi:hypothetical protein
VGVGDQFRHHPAPVDGYLLTIASTIPGEIKVGFCVAALCAGMPFAPLLARLAKADVSISTTLLVVLTAATIIALPLGLPLAIDAVDAQLKTSVWDVAWPLLLFLLLPVVLGCGFRVWWPDLAPPLARWVVRVAILCLLFNLNFTLVAYWNQFVQTWGTESYIGALAGPFIGLGCGYLLVTSLRVKDVGIRHATETTTAIRNIAPMLLMMIFPLCSRPAGHGVDHDPQHGRHRDRSTVRPDVEARCFTIGPSRKNKPASKRRPAPANFDVTSDPPVVADLPDEGEFFLVPVGANPPRHVVIFAPSKHTHMPLRVRPARVLDRLVRPRHSAIRSASMRTVESSPFRLVINHRVRVSATMSRRSGAKGDSTPDLFSAMVAWETRATGCER